MKQIIQRLVGVMSLLLLGSMFAFPALVGGAQVTPPATPGATPVDTKASLCEGIGLAGGGTPDCTDPADTPTVNSTIALVINILSLIVGIIAVIMIIIGGLKYITSGGDSGNVTSAKNTILYAVIGLVVVALAQVIVRFVINRATQP